jgi:hypothetical protein
MRALGAADEEEPDMIRRCNLKPGQAIGMAVANASASFA